MQINILSKYLYTHPVYRIAALFNVLILGSLTVQSYMSMQVCTFEPGSQLLYILDEQLQ